MRAHDAGRRRGAAAAAAARRGGGGAVRCSRPERGVVRVVGEDRAAAACQLMEGVHDLARDDLGPARLVPRVRQQRQVHLRNHRRAWSGDCLLVATSALGSLAHVSTAARGAREGGWGLVARAGAAATSWQVR